jgi:hypothetical protein
MLAGALAAARVFAYCTEDRTAALRARLINLRTSLADIPENWSLGFPKANGKQKARGAPNWYQRRAAKLQKREK